MNDGSSWPSESVAPARKRVPHNGMEEESPVTRALEVVFQLPSEAVRRPQKRPMVQAGGLEEYPLPSEPNAEQAEPDWKQRQAEKIRAWRLKTSQEPRLAANGYQAQTRLHWQSKEYQERAQQRADGSLAETKPEADTGLGHSPQIPGNPDQQTQEDSDPKGQRDTGNIEETEESCDDEEEACLAPCSDDEELATMEQHEDKPDKICKKKKVSRGNDPQLVQTNNGNKFNESHSLGSNQTEVGSILIPGLSCSAMSELQPDQVDTMSSSIHKDLPSGITKGDHPGRSRSWQQGDDASLSSALDHLPGTVGEQGDMPAADKSWVLCQAAKIKAWREAKSRELLQARSDLNLESGSGVKTEGFAPWREVAHKRIHDPVESRGEQYGLSLIRDQAEHVAVRQGNVHWVPESQQTMEAQLGVSQNIEHREYMELASSRGRQVENVSQSPVSENTESIAGGKLMSDKSWALFQAAKIKAWREAKSRSDPNMVQSSLHVEATNNPKQRVIEAIPVQQSHTRWNSSHGEELTFAPSAPNIEPIHGTNQWTVESTPVQSAYTIEAGDTEQRREELTVAQSNRIVEVMHRAKQWAIESMRVHQGSRIETGLEPPGRGGLTVSPSALNIKGVYDDKWPDVESNSVYLPQGIRAEWETTSSGKSTLMPRDHNAKAAQLEVDGISVDQTPGIQHWWQAASVGDPDLERNHLNRESMYSAKQGAVESTPVRQTPETESWREAACKGKAGLLNIEAAYGSKWGEVESMPVSQTAGVSSRGEAVRIGNPAYTWEQTLTSSLHSVPKKPIQLLPNDSLAWWRETGDRASHQADKVQAWRQDRILGKKDWSRRGRHAAKLQSESNLSFIEAEKKRMQVWAQSVWSQAASKQEPFLKPMSLQHD